MQRPLCTTSAKSPAKHGSLTKAISSSATGLLIASGADTTNACTSTGTMSHRSEDSCLTCGQGHAVAHSGKGCRKHSTAQSDCSRQCCPPRASNHGRRTGSTGSRTKASCQVSPITVTCHFTVAATRAWYQVQHISSTSRNTAICCSTPYTM